MRCDGSVEAAHAGGLPRNDGSERGGMSPDSREAKERDGFAPVLERNIAALMQQRRELARQDRLQERLATAIGNFTGSMPFVYLHVVLFGVWIAINLGWTPVRPFDPTFVVLAMVASVEAIFLSTFVLITQNRLSRDAERRAELDLQISLLAEHEITTLLKLVTEIAEKLGLADAKAPEIQPLKRDVQPEKVLERIEAAERKRTRGERP